MATGSKWLLARDSRRRVIRRLHKKSGAIKRLKFVDQNCELLHSHPLLVSSPSPIYLLYPSPSCPDLPSLLLTPTRCPYLSDSASTVIQIQLFSLTSTPLFTTCAFQHGFPRTCSTPSLKTNQPLFLLLSPQPPPAPSKPLISSQHPLPLTPRGSRARSHNLRPLR